jgi:cysteinyl-tRNA synthetase
MHKSLGNFITLAQSFERWDPMVIRFFVLQSHYRGPMDVTDEALDAAKTGYGRLASAIREVNRRQSTAPAGEVMPEVSAMLGRAREAFGASMDDDFNTPGALAALFDLTREVNTLLNSGAALSQGTLAAIGAFYQRTVGDALGLLPEGAAEPSAGAGLLPALVELLIETRARLRQAKQYQMADNIRDQLTALGVQLKDGADGTTWTLA